MAVKIHPTAIIEGEVELGENVEIGPYSVISGKIKIGDNCRVISSVSIQGNTTIGSGCIFWPFAAIGGDPQDLKYKGEDSQLIIGNNCIFRESSNVHRGTAVGRNKTQIGDNCLIMVYCHVAHDCWIGNNTIMSTFSALGGHVDIGNHVTICSYGGVQQNLAVGDYSMVGAYTGLRLDLTPYTMAKGADNPRIVKVNRVRLDRCNISKEDQVVIDDVYKMFFRGGNSKDKAIDLINKKFAGNHYAQEFVKFVEKSKNGILR